MDEQPEGWTAARLGDVCEVNPRKPPADLLGKHAPVTFIPMAAVDEIAGAITRRETRPYGDVRKGYTAFAEGDVILAKITPCFENGKAAIATDLENDIGFGSSEFHVLRPLGGVIAKYIYQYLRQPRFREEAANHMTGTAGQERVSVEYVRDHELPVPPTTEQWRIIEKLEALLTRVSAARERLERVPRLLKRFRQAVLAAACEGRLTEGWREASPTSLASDGALHDWTTTTLGELTSLVTSGSRGWAQYYADAGPLFIRAQDINADELRLDDVAHVRPPRGSEGARTRVKQHDLLVTITGANVTKTAFVREPISEAYVSQHVALVRLHEPALDSWVHLWLLSPAHGRKQLLEYAYGAGKPGLNLDNVRDVTLAVPPDGEREEIVRRIQSLFSLADAIERRVTAALVRAEKLPQAILSRAFAGELVPTEAELARSEGRSYETAEELLERIRMERVADGPPKRRKAPARGPNKASTAKRSS
jgi:type I restriction enzyme, S subunit